MQKYDYLIVGSGFFGATFAQLMNSYGKKCLVIESNDHVGGLSATKRRENIDVHLYGPHIFHTSKQAVWDYVLKFAAFNNFINAPLAIYEGVIYNLPFNMNTFAKMWNIITPNEAKQIIEEQKKRYGVENPTNMEEQAISSVGIDIYEKLIKGYTEKQWGMSAKDLPASIIKRLPVRFTYDNNYFNDPYQGIPVNGYTEMIESMLSGIEVRLQTNYFDQKELYDSLAEKIVYTGAIDRFFNYCHGPLEYRSLKFETATMDCQNFQGNAVINYTEKNIPYTRIIEHKHFNPRPDQPKTIITKEYPYAWESGGDPYYPINNPKNDGLYEKYLSLAKQLPNVIFGGRLAEYKYYNMDQAIASAMDLVHQELRL